MISVVFYEDKEKILGGFLVSGHANFLEHGKDIVCSAVSSSVQMCCNGITEILKEKVEIFCDEGKISLKGDLNKKPIQDFLKALKLQLSLIEKQYPKNIKLDVVEVS